MSAVVPPSRKIFGPFEVIAKIGAGGTASVYKVRHLPTGKVAALKVSPRGLKLSADAVRRFRQEFTKIRPLRHPNLVRAVGWGEHAGFTYLAMEFVPGQNLESRLSQQGALTPEEAVTIFLQVADGLRYLHENHILHRDIKPSNIFLNPANQAKLGDFGLLKSLADDGELTPSRQSMGTIEYGAPEQFEDAKRVDQRCDLYSLAASLYTALTGKFPFGHGGQMQILQRKFLKQVVPLRMLVPGLDPAVDRLVCRCLHPDVAERPDSCEEFQAVLRNYRAAPICDSPADIGPDAVRVKGPDRRASVRFEVDLTATFVPFHQKTRGRWDVTIVDACAHGVRLRTPRPVAVNSVLQLTLGQVGRTELALVRWVRPDKNETQLLGCSFIQPLSSEEFKSLFLPSPRKPAKT
jgi:serine/threonine-protein kinase